MLELSSLHLRAKRPFQFRPSQLCGDHCNVFLEHFCLVLVEYSITGVKPLLHSRCCPASAVTDMRRDYYCTLEARPFSECRHFRRKLLCILLLELYETSS